MRRKQALSNRLKEEAGSLSVRQRKRILQKIGATNRKIKELDTGSACSSTDRDRIDVRESRKRTAGDGNRQEDAGPEHPSPKKRQRVELTRKQKTLHRLRSNLSHESTIPVSMLTDMFVICMGTNIAPL